MPVNHAVAILQGACNGVNMITTLRFMGTYASLAEKQAQALAVRDSFLNGFKVASTSAMIWTAITCRNFGDENDAPYILPILVAGQGGSTSAPQQLAILIHLQTGQAGRNGRGRLFIPGLSTSVFANGILGGAAASQMPVVIGNWNSRWGGGGGDGLNQMAVYSRVNNAIYAVTSFSYNTTISTLRSRRLGTGI